MLSIRSDNNIHELFDVNGVKYNMRKSAYGWGEEYIFYDDEHKVIEFFLPSDNYYGNEDVLIDDDYVMFFGRVISAKFTVNEFYKW